MAGTQAAPAAVSETAPAKAAEPAAIITASPEPEKPAPTQAAAPPAVTTATSEPAKPAPAAPEAPTHFTTTPAAAKAGAPAPAPGKNTAEVEQHIARLRRALKITPAQQTQWDAFAEVMRENAAHMDAVTKTHPELSDKQNAVEGLKSYEEVTQAHLEDLQKLEPAFETLYGTFSDSQKKVADGMFRRQVAVAHPAKPRAAATTEQTE